MALCPFAVWRPIGSHSGTRLGNYGFVEHCETVDGSPYGFFSDPANQASSHFWVGVDGTLEQYVDTSLEAWAQIAGNPYYVSCEFEGPITAAKTAAQMAMGARLLAWCAEEDGFPLTPTDHGGRGVTFHCFYEPPDFPPDPAWGDHTCPGPGPRLTQLPEMISMATNQPPEGNNMITLTILGQDHVFIVDGTGTLWHYWWQPALAGPPPVPAGWHKETRMSQLVPNSEVVCPQALGQKTAAGNQIDLYVPSANFPTQLIAHAYLQNGVWGTDTCGDA